MSDFVRSRMERTSLPWKSDIRPHIRRLNLKNARRGEGERTAPPRRRPLPPHGFETSRPIQDQNKRGRTRGSRSCLWVVEEGLLGWVWRGQARLKDVHGLPVAAEILRDARRELEPHAKSAVLEEDVGVLQLGHVEGD